MTIPLYLTVPVKICTPHDRRVIRSRLYIHILYGSTLFTMRLPIHATEQLVTTL